MVIEKALKKLNRLVVSNDVSWNDNIYQPKIKSSYTPPKASYNEVFEHIYKQLKPKQ